MQKYYYFQNFLENTRKRDLFLAKLLVLNLNIHHERFFIHIRESFRKPAIFIKFSYLEILQIFAVVADAQ